MVSGVSILNFSVLRKRFRLLRSKMGLYLLLGFGTKKAVVVPESMSGIKFQAIYDLISKFLKTAKIIFLVKMCRHLGWLVNVEKSELEPKQVFNFVGYQFDLESGRVRPTPDRWQSLQEKILELIS